MAGFIGKLLGSFMFMIMIATLSRKFTGKAIARHLAAFALMFLGFVLFPLNTFLNGLMFSLILVFVIYRIYEEKTFATAMYAFFIIFIFLSSSMIMTNLTIWLRHKYVDFSRVFETGDALYQLGLFIVIAIKVAVLKLMLHNIKGAYYQIRDNQVRIYIANALIAVLYIVFLRINIYYSVRIVALDNSGVDRFMLFHLIFSNIMFIWLFVFVNSRILRTGSMSSRLDPATDAHNRADGVQKLGMDMNRAYKTNIPLTVIYINVIGLKTIHDAVERVALDEVLLKISSIIRQGSETGYLTRVSERDFFLTLPEQDLNKSKIMWNEIENNMRSYKNMNHDKFTFTLRSGFSQFDPKHHDSLKELLTDAANNH